MGYKCAVPNCPSRRPKVRLHSVPFTNKARWEKWLYEFPFLRKYTFMQLNNIRICRLHFVPQHINEKGLLTKDAFPLLNLPENPHQAYRLEINPLTNASDEETNTAVREKMYKLEIAPLTQQNSRDKYSVKVISQHTKELISPCISIEPKDMKFDGNDENMDCSQSPTYDYDEDIEETVLKLSLTKGTLTDSSEMDTTESIIEKRVRLLEELSSNKNEKKSITLSLEKKMVGNKPIIIIKKQNMHKVQLVKGLRRLNKEGVLHQTKLIKVQLSKENLTPQIQQISLLKISQPTTNTIGNKPSVNNDNQTNLTSEKPKVTRRKRGTGRKPRMCNKGMQTIPSFILDQVQIAKVQVHKNSSTSTPRISVIPEAQLKGMPIPPKDPDKSASMPTEVSVNEHLTPTCVKNKMVLTKIAPKISKPVITYSENNKICAQFKMSVSTQPIKMSILTQTDLNEAQKKHEEKNDSDQITNNMKEYLAFTPQNKTLQVINKPTISGPVLNNSNSSRICSQLDMPFLRQPNNPKISIAAQTQINKQFMVQKNLEKSSTSEQTKQTVINDKFMVTLPQSKTVQKINYTPTIINPVPKKPLNNKLFTQIQIPPLCQPNKNNLPSKINVTKPAAPENASKKISIINIGNVHVPKVIKDAPPKRIPVLSIEPESSNVPIIKVTHLDPTANQLPDISTPMQFDVNLGKDNLNPEPLQPTTPDTIIIAPTITNSNHPQNKKTPVKKHGKTKSAKNAKKLLALEELPDETSTTPKKISRTPVRKLYKHKKKISSEPKLKSNIGKQRKIIQNDGKIVKTRLRGKIFKKKVKLDKTEEFLKQNDFLSNFGNLIVNTMPTINRSMRKKPNNYTSDEKMFAFTMWRLRPECYRFLSKALLLPLRHDLKKLMLNMPLRPGLNDVIFQYLTHTTLGKTERKKQCVLLFEEVSISKKVSFNFHTGVLEGFESYECNNTVVAEKCLVFMLCGIFSSWRIPIAFYFVRDGFKTDILKSIITEVIYAVHASGYTVRATVSNHDPCNVAVINSFLSATRQLMLQYDVVPSSVMFYNIGDSIVYHTYDVPSLLKCFRNDLMEKDIVVDGRAQRAQWKFLEALLKVDGFNSNSCSTKLTGEHLKPDSKPILAAQLFSKQVAMCLEIFAKTLSVVNEQHARVSSDNYTENGLFTAQIVMFMNDLFDSLNSCGDTDEKLKERLSPTSEHFTFWESAENTLSSMKFSSDSTESSECCIKYFLHNIKTIKNLWRDLQNVPTVCTLNLRRLNKDPLARFIDHIRGQGYDDNSDCHYIVCAFKNLFVNTLLHEVMIYHHKGTEDEIMLAALTNYALRKSNIDSYVTDVFSEIAHSIEELVPHEVETPRTVSYIASAVCEKLFPKLKNYMCEACQTSLGDIVEYRRRWSVTGLSRTRDPVMSYPSKPLSKLVLESVSIVESVLPNISGPYVYIELIVALETYTDTSWFQCGPHKDLFLSAFWVYVIRLKLEQWCHDYNNSLPNNRGRSVDREIVSKIKPLNRIRRLRST